MWCKSFYFKIPTNLIFFYPQILKMCDPILVTLIKKSPDNSQSSRENATPSSGTYPLSSISLQLGSTPLTIATYTVGQCSINSSQIVISPYTEDDGGPSTHVCHFFSTVKTVFQSIKTRGVLLGILVSVPPGSPVLTLFQTKKCHFSHPLFRPGLWEIMSSLLKNGNKK